jgi:hypothetical protein
MRRTISGLAMLLVLTGARTGAAADGPAPRCQAQLIAELDLVATADGTFLVPLSIGSEPVWMVLNTGGSITLLLQPAVDRLHLETAVVSGERVGVSIGKDPIIRRTTLTSLTAGSHRYSPLVAGVVPGPMNSPLVELDGKPIVGYFGTEVLSRTDFELHLAQKKLRLFTSDHCRGVGAYWTKTYAQTTFGRDPYGGIFFAMGLEGKLIETTLATGSSLTSVDANVTRRAFGFDTASPGIEVQDDSRASYRAMALTMPGLNVSDVRIRLRTTSEDCGFRERTDSGSKAIAYGKCLLVFPLSLGRDVLQRMRLYVALKERKIYFSEADAGL